MLYFSFQQLFCCSFSSVIHAETLMPQGPLSSVLVAHMLLPSLDNQLVDVLPYEGESELSEHYFHYYWFSMNWIPQFTIDVLPSTWWQELKWHTVKLTSAGVARFPWGKEQDGDLSTFCYHHCLSHPNKWAWDTRATSPVQLYLSHSRELTLQNTELSFPVLFPMYL